MKLAYYKLNTDTVPRERIKELSAREENEEHKDNRNASPNPHFYGASEIPV